jgi:thiol-disulfide isomerase/thioredoxin
LAFLAVIAFPVYYFWLKPMQDDMLERLRLAAPVFYIFSPRQAELDFSVVGTDGKPLDLKDYRGRVVVLNVWATWCVPCMVELPSLGKLAAHYSGEKDVVVICLSQEPKSTVFRDTEAISSGAPLYSSDGQQLPSVYKTDGIPATFVIDKNGMIVFGHVGSANWDHPSVIKFIDSVRQRSNKSPEPTAVGAVSSAVAVHVASRRWLSFFR